MRAGNLVLSLLFISVVALSSVSAEDAAEGGEKPGLRNEEDIAKMRDEALAKLETPLEKMKVKELKALLTDRGVSCTACSEKAQLVQTVRDNIHLPIKKDHLKKMQAPPRQVEDEEVNKILEQVLRGELAQAQDSTAKGLRG